MSDSSICMSKTTLLLLICSRRALSKHREKYGVNLCQFSLRYFSRKYNRDRHEKQGCQKRPKEKEEEMPSQYALSEGSQDAFAPEKTDEDYEKELSQDDEEQEDKYDDDEDINTKDGN